VTGTARPGGGRPRRCPSGAD